MPSSTSLRLAQAAGPTAVVVLTVLTRPGWPLDRLDALAAAIVRRRSPAGFTWPTSAAPSASLRRPVRQSPWPL